MLKWIHHLLEPHCPDCASEAQDKSICHSCETLKHQLEIANFERKQLLETVLKLSQPTSQLSIQDTVTPEMVRPRTVPWNVRRQMLEEEDRKQAQLIRESAERNAKLAKAVDRGPSGGLTTIIGDKTQEESINKLEKELGIENPA